METKNIRDEIIELLAGSEETIGKLYTTYANRFHETEPFWKSLAEDERNHAIWIRSLKAKSGNNKLIFNPDRFRSAAIKTFINHTEKEIIEAGKPGYQLINALSMAYFIEDSLIEKKYFEVFEADSVELKGLLNKLESATKKHALQVKEARDKYNKQVKK
jgi:hypothetical protein